MDKYSKRDQQFIDEVWNKVRYLEYVKSEKELVKKREKALRRKKLLFSIPFIAIALIIIISIVLLDKITMELLFVAGILLISESLLYEYLLSIKLCGGDLL